MRFDILLFRFNTQRRLSISVFGALVVALSHCQILLAQPIPLVRAHAHNDYEHDRPLSDALAHGFCSFEADIHLVNGDLLVAHDLDEVQPGQTLQALYLDPLRERVHRYAGRVYPDGPSVILLIDIKSEAEATYQVLRRILRRYADILTITAGEEVEEGAVTVILSGNRPRATLASEPIRFAAFDGRLEDLQEAAPVSPAFMPLISSNWATIAPWFGTGILPERARQRLYEVVSKAHKQGRKIRFWATTDNPVVWTVLYEAGVDLINTDDLEGLRAFLYQMGDKQ